MGCINRMTLTVGDDNTETIGGATDVAPPSIACVAWMIWVAESSNVADEVERKDGVAGVDFSVRGEGSEDAELT